MKAAIYVRVSTDKQDLANQRSLCQRHCEAKGWEVYHIYEDIISGTKDSRPSFNQLLTDLRHYKFDVIVISKLDRLARSLQHLLSLMDEFGNKGVQLVAVTQPIDTTTPTGKLFFQITGAFAEFERNLISERTKEGLRGKKNVGKRGRDKRPRKKRGGLRLRVK